VLKYISEEESGNRKMTQCVTLNIFDRLESGWQNPGSVLLPDVARLWTKMLFLYMVIIEDTMRLDQRHWSQMIAWCAC